MMDHPQATKSRRMALPGVVDFQEHPTPYFVVSEDRILQNYGEFAQAFPDCEICYAMKANSEPRVLELLRDVGSSFEVASIYELELLKRESVDPSRIIYGSAVKPAEHVRAFFNCGVNRFAFDSVAELEKITASAPNSKVLARLRVDDRGSVFRFSEKFGTDEASVVRLLKLAAKNGLKPYGISFHVGSQARDLNAWARGVAQARAAIEELQQSGISVEILNIGGGFPCKYADDDVDLPLSAIAKPALSELDQFPYKIRLVVEPGRRIVGNSAVAVATVIGIADRDDMPWLFLDLGPYNGLFEAMPFQGSTRYTMKNLSETKQSPDQVFAVAGPTGDSADVISRRVRLPASTKVGDRILIENVGAYSIVLSSAFNGFPKPRVFYV